MTKSIGSEEQDILDICGEGPEYAYDKWKIGVLLTHLAKIMAGTCPWCKSNGEGR